eukprot:1704214-Prymnesium_polylepis.1
MDRDGVVARPLIHALGRDACHVDRPVVDTHPRDIEEATPLGATHPEAERHVLVLPPHARADLALFQAHAPAGGGPSLDARLGTPHERGDLGRFGNVAHQRRRQQLKRAVHERERRVRALARAVLLAVVATARLPRPAAKPPDGRVIAREAHRAIVQVRCAVQPLHVGGEVANVQERVV